MENPCKKCLVQVTCWQECEDKKNYSILLSSATRNLRSLLMVSSYRKQYDYYLKLICEHTASKEKIYERARLMSKEI